MVKLRGQRALTQERRTVDEQPEPAIHRATTSITA